MWHCNLVQMQRKSKRTFQNNESKKTLLLGKKWIGKTIERALLFYPPQALLSNLTVSQLQTL